MEYAQRGQIKDVAASTNVEPSEARHDDRIGSRNTYIEQPQRGQVKGVAVVVFENVGLGPRLVRRVPVPAAAGSR